MKSISEIVGHADSVGKSSFVVYRALRPLLCAVCGGVIEEGTMFTRRSLLGQGLRILPQCRKCAPFELRAKTEDERHQSTLLKALLAPQKESKRDKRKPHEQEAI